ncbi:iron ABC transporter permease [candidate division KSB1 bacterium]|nr:iron ABC transporter permease [candidate division KSB1 bacterium]NIR72698.1 iron ABC transporter permease [candidate division KSB1 bacterium]NIS26783.1 iron ABC transporter permease [candidate division KSB1 bacterium]NIT73577.1 iron ABC transporter permease [candidate division KSB1 bacterium]NIU27453.1 iron ABC transporter permease [candidate division KSB1 bacterium]
MNLPCLILILSFVLYPYVFLIARSSFLLQSQSLLETSRILGKSQTQTFFRVILPLARPAIIGGVMLVIMEVINDYGAVKYFGVDTFTTGIFRAWFSMGDTDAAIRLCGFLMFVALCLITLERAQRGRAKFDNNAKTSRTLNKTVLTKKKAGAAFLICLTPVLLGFLIPASQLLFWASQTANNVLGREFFTLIANSFFLAVLASFLCVIVAIIIVYSVRLRQSLYTQAISKISILGYSIPGAVIAVGVMIPFAWVDIGVDTFFRDHFGASTGLILSGTLVAVTFAYVVRFLALAFNPIKSGFERLCGNMDEASRSLGHSPLKSLLKVNIPIIKGALMAAAILVFVDVLKELPLTLIMRPFNFDTLATKTFELASDEMVAESATPALIIVATGIVPIILMNRLLGKISNERTNRSKSFEDVLPC